ncbi:MAG TPA: O-antigen ligase family protein, partial [Solirubrobacteraceae bacterium]
NAARRTRRPGISLDAALGTVLAAGFALVAFLTAGGTDLGPNTWVEIAIALVGAGGAVAVVLYGGAGRAWGGITLLLFVALAALTFASIGWSVQPDDSWAEANRTLSYLAAFGAAMAIARILPKRWPAVLGAVAAAMTVICAYALVVKTFPGTFDADDPVGRLKAPFDYWNATGLAAALGVPACVWAGARVAPGRVLRTLSIPSLAILLTVLVLSYSRGAVIAVIVACGLWFAITPMRLRATAVLGLGAAGGAVLSLWALTHHALTHDSVSLAARIHAGHVFGVVVLVVLVALTVAGFAAVAALDRVVLEPVARRRVGTALLVALALVPIVGVVGLAASSRGLTGEVSHLWTSLTSANGVVSETPGRLVELSNSRPRYWREGLKVGEHALLKGVGAGGFETARGRYSSDALVVGHAHSYAIETFADFGLIGTALSLALLIAWALATGRTLGVGRQPREPEPSAMSAVAIEQTGMITMLAIVLTFGIHSTIDWTWFFPGVAIPALFCAGWLAGRGPLSHPVGRVERKRLTTAPAAGGIVVAIAAIAIAAGWVVWQPLRSADAANSAVNELLAGNTGAALTDARTAVDTDPVSADTLWELSEIYVAAGDRGSARAALVRARDRQPSNPESWQRIGEFDVRYHKPQLALSELNRAALLDHAAVQPLWDLAAAYTALNNPAAARNQLAVAAARQPHNPDAWQMLGIYDLRHGAPLNALPELRASNSLGSSPQTVALIAKAQRALSAQQARQAAAAKAAARRSRRR